MSYIRCDTCGWSQDDFYDDHYNPAQFLKSWNNELFGEGREGLDKPFSNDPEFIHQNGHITLREVIAREYEKFAKRIRNMKWVTLEDFKKCENKKCPVCGSDDLTID